MRFCCRDLLWSTADSVVQVGGVQRGTRAPARSADPPSWLTVVGSVQTLRGPAPPRNVRGEGTVPLACQIVRGTTGNSGDWPRVRPGPQHHSAAGQYSNCSQKTRASQADGLRSVVTGPAVAGCSGRRRKPSSVAEAGGGAARHTRAWSVDAPAVVADCRRLRLVPLPCQMQRSATVNAGRLAVELLGISPVMENGCLRFESQRFLQQLRRHCTGMRGRSALRSGRGLVEPPANHGVTVRELVPCQFPVPRLGLFAGVLASREPPQEGVTVRVEEGLPRLALRLFRR